MLTCILNGEFVNRAEAKFDIEDRGYQFGDGIYEVIRVYNGKMFTAEEHVSRLFESAEKLSMNIEYDAEEILNLLEQLVTINKLELGIIYLQFTRGVAPRTHAFPKEQGQSSFVAYTREMDRPEELMKTGVEVVTTEDIRWLRCDIKSLNLLGNIVAKETAQAANCFEAIQHRDGMVTEGSSANVMIVKDGQVITHPANNLILNGITRQTLAKLCSEHKLAFLEKEYSIEELYKADEIFLTGTTTEVMPVIKVDNKQIGAGLPGKITMKLQNLFTEEINKECF